MFKLILFALRLESSEYQLLLVETLAVLFRAGYFHLGTIDIWGRTILCCAGGLSCASYAIYCPPWVLLNGYQ